MPHSTYLPDKMGTAEVSPEGAFEAGSFQEFTLTYSAGIFGIIGLMAAAERAEDRLRAPPSLRGQPICGRFGPPG